MVAMPFLCRGFLNHTMELKARLYNCHLSFFLSFKKQILICMNRQGCHIIWILAIHWSSNVWLPAYAPMGADVGVFQVADAPTYGYFCTLPPKNISTFLPTINC